MNGRQRLLTTLRREMPDRVPFDLRLTRGARELFVAHTGSEDPQEQLGIDYRFAPVNPPATLPDFTRYFAGRAPDWPEEDWAAWRPPLVDAAPMYPHFFRLGRHTAINEWGEYRVFDDEWSYHRKIYPLGEAECSVADIDAFPFPDLFSDERYAGVAAGISAIHARGLAALLFLEMTLFEKAWRIRGMENLLMDFLINPAVAERLLDEVVRRTATIARRYAEAGADIICLGDDVGAERAMMISPKIWRRWLKPRLASVVAGIKAANPDTLVFYHSDGKIEPIIPDLIEIGIDILNPIQPETMDAAWLKREYGQHLSFWGGIGVQTTMPFGTPAEVHRAVRSLIDVAGPTGLLVAPAHVIEPDVPWDNIVAFLEAVQEYGRLD